MAVLGVLALPGCSAETVDDWQRAGLPEGITEESEIITTLWQGAWVVALIVGFFVWGLIFWATVFHRRRRGDTGLPPQVRYNVPIEVLYTAVPVVLVAVYFFFTVRDQTAILAFDEARADHTIEVVAKRWSWDFNYLDDDVYETGTPGVPPVLVLPEGERVHFQLVSRDVIHSFWVPAFLFKMDAFPGQVNRFEVTPTKTGTFAGKCAELCGFDHARMLFTVDVVSPEQYDERLDELREAGQVGRLPATIGPNRGPEDLTDPTSDVQDGSVGSETG